MKGRTWNRFNTPNPFHPYHNAVGECTSITPLDAVRLTVEDGQHAIDVVRDWLDSQGLPLNQRWSWGGDGCGWQMTGGATCEYLWHENHLFVWDARSSHECQDISRNNVTYIKQGFFTKKFFDTRYYGKQGETKFRWFHEAERAASKTIMACYI